MPMRCTAICRSRALRIDKGIRYADYGMRTFVLADPVANRVDVGEDL